MNMSKNSVKLGQRVEKASRFIYNSKKLLDIGCGDGEILDVVEPRQIVNVYGIDNNPDSLKIAQKKGMNVKICDINLEKIPYVDNFFDHIICLDVIEHVSNPRFLLSEAYRVLRKGGKIILSTPNIRFSDHLITLVLKGNFPKTSIDQHLYDGGHIHFFTYKDLEYLLRESKFKNIRRDGIINKDNRGWKGRLIHTVFGKRFMEEFRTPGILLIAEK